MRKLIAYNFVTINGIYNGPDEDISWHNHKEEELKYSEDMLALNHILLFGRKTYEQMAGFWPTKVAKETMPAVAEGMNKAEKIVFSNRDFNGKLWENTHIMSGDIAKKIKKLKQLPGKDMALLGSGSIISLFTDHNLIDEFQIMVDPVAIGEGDLIFRGIKKTLLLELLNVKVFSSGAVLLNYKQKL